MRDPHELNQHKQSALEESLSVGMTSVYIDSTREGVSLPDHLMGQPRVILNLSYLFKLKVFEIDREGVRASLSFGGSDFLCVLPWESLYLLHLADPADAEDVGALFWESIPPVMRSQFEALATHLGLDSPEALYPATHSSDEPAVELTEELTREPIDESQKPEAEHDPSRGLFSLNRMRTEVSPKEK